MCGETGVTKIYWLDQVDGVEFEKTSFLMDKVLSPDIANAKEIMTRA